MDSVSCIGNARHAATRLAARLGGWRRSMLVTVLRRGMAVAAVGLALAGCTESTLKVLGPDVEATKGAQRTLASRYKAVLGTSCAALQANCFVRFRAFPTDPSQWDSFADGHFDDTVTNTIAPVSTQIENSQSVLLVLVDPKSGFFTVRASGSAQRGLGAIGLLKGRDFRAFQLMERKNGVEPCLTYLQAVRDTIDERLLSRRNRHAIPIIGPAMRWFDTDERHLTADLDAFGAPGHVLDSALSYGSINLIRGGLGWPTLRMVQVGLALTKLLGDGVLALTAFLAIGIALGQMVRAIARKGLRAYPVASSIVSSLAAYLILLPFINALYVPLDGRLEDVVGLYALCGYSTANATQTALQLQRFIQIPTGFFFCVVAGIFATMPRILVMMRHEKLSNLDPKIQRRIWATLSPARQKVLKATSILQAGAALEGAGASAGTAETDFVTAPYSALAGNAFMTYIGSLVKIYIACFFISATVLLILAVVGIVSFVNGLREFTHEPLPDMAEFERAT